MEIKPLVILLFIYLICLFNFLRVIMHKQPGVKIEELGQGTGVVLELTLRAEVNVKIILIHYLNNA